MPVTDYHFVSRWRVPGTVEEVADVLGDAEGLARWWPSVYLKVETLEPGGERGAGKLVRLHTKGWLPYTLRWEFRTVAADYPRGYEVEAVGDLEGRGRWTFTQDGEFVNATYDWRVRARKPLLRALSFLLKPAFAANHRWAMARGEESLRLELLRRRARTPEELARIPAPPPPTFSRNKSA
ncbi:MAG TPA: SRPBCC family protein [Pyrinomonadaceae bacterium]